MDNEFTHSNILKIFPNVKARTMISWSERGLIQPLQDAAGRGSARIYSYTNIMEIGIIKELLQHGIPFSHIVIAMRSDKMKNLLKSEMWDTIFWISRGETLGLSKRMPVVSFGVTPIDEFLVTGGKMIMGVGTMTLTEESTGRVMEGPFPVTFKSSAVVINVSTLKQYVDYMIRKL
jgi:DNA-binding transcriptional MerR regulator